MVARLRVSFELSHLVTGVSGLIGSHLAERLIFFSAVKKFAIPLYLSSELVTATTPNHANALKSRGISNVILVPNVTELISQVCLCGLVPSGMTGPHRQELTLFSK